jgi:hypothetical protein
MYYFPVEFTKIIFMNKYWREKNTGAEKNNTYPDKLCLIFQTTTLANNSP